MSRSRSLKWFTPGLARLLGTTAPRLYEREQALIRAGILDASPGRGPGSGVRATAPSIALLIIAMLAAETLRETESRTKEIAELTPVDAERCPLRGTRSFLYALTDLVSSRSRSSRTIEVKISRTAARAMIVFYRDRERLECEFTGPNAKEPALRVSATLDGTVIKQIAIDVSGVLNVLDSDDDGDAGEGPR
jgi:hypothetical protein